MKIRYGFVSNSSSSSYIVAGIKVPKDFDLSKELILKILKMNFDKFEIKESYGLKKNELEEWELDTEKFEDHIYEAFYEVGYQDFEEYLDSRIIGKGIECSGYNVKELSLLQLSQLYKKGLDHFNEINELTEQGEIKLYWIGKSPS